jgi:hypothetical protein
MKSFKFALPLMLALVVSAYVKAEDAPAPAAKEESWSGVLAAKPADAKEGVVATLKVGDKVVTLWATDKKVAEELTAWAAKGAKAKVTGTKVDDANVKVSKAEAEK